MTRREELVAKVMAQNPDENEVVVSLEDFFEGNDDRGSIGANLGPEQPSIAKFHRILSAIRDRRDVEDVLVRIFAVEEDESWPYTDTVYVLSSAPAEEVAQLLEPLRPDEVNEGWMYGKPPKAPEHQPPTTVYSVWWD